ncbi:hypothetical protein PVK06_023684 [Gossypium arboreum]|uniref:Uncharacterized protein n=1 Tax=Gossypium arboreum TaxID=29729 RepID=A0ABR0PC38_GOSAR|nr:hypothetical protein PVK06_023684 [Gossypium arboreum]
MSPTTSGYGERVVGQVELGEKKHELLIELRWHGCDGLVQNGAKECTALGGCYQCPCAVAGHLEDNTLNSCVIFGM